VVEIRPNAVSSIMGLFSADFVKQIKSHSIAWFATATTVAEARAAECAGADAIIAQGMEAGGHRGSFASTAAEASMVGTLALVPAIADAVDIPVIAAGGISDHRGTAAALLLGASAVTIGTGFLRTPEAHIPTAWADALAQAAPEGTCVSRVFSGRAGRSLRTAYVMAATASDAPAPAPYPVQRGLTSGAKLEAARNNDLDAMQAWAGQGAALAPAEPAAGFVERLWRETTALLDWERTSVGAD
jgi:nitronate monooxygenase